MANNSNRPKRRTWVFCQSPATYEVFCDKCGNIECEWSEFVGHVWCAKCKEDVKGTEGVFGGPIGVAVCAMIGLFFHRVSIKTGRVSYMDERGKYSGWKKVAA